MDDLLCTFSNLFIEPTGLPPQRDHFHEIRLLPGTPPLVMQPYHYAYMQKQELECQCVAMVQTECHLAQHIFLLSTGAAGEEG
jgi:hypothetical protein